MNPKNTLMLVMLAAGLFAFIYFYESKLKPPAPVVSRVLPNLRMDEITSVSIHPQGESEIRVERTNGGWRMVRPVDYELKPGVVEAFLRRLEELTAGAHISPGELAGRPGIGEEFGTGNAQFSVVVQQGIAERRLNLGKPNAPGDQIYAQVVGGTNGIALIPAEFIKNLPRKADEWRDTTFVKLENLPFDRLTVANGTSSFELQRAGSNELWRLTKPIPARADNGILKMKLEQLQSLRVNKFVPDAAGENAESTGLRSPELEMTFYQGTNQLLSLQFGRSPTNDTNQVFARSSAHRLVVQVPGEPLAGWRSGANAFRNHHLVSVNVPVPDVTVWPFDDIEVTGSAGQDSYNVRLLTNNTWQVTDGQKQTFPADLAVFQYMLGILFQSMEVVPQTEGELQQIVNETLLPDKPELGLAPPLRRYVFKKTGVGMSGTIAPVVIAQADFGSLNTNTNKPAGSAPTMYARRSDEATDERSYVYDVKVGDFQRLPSSAVELRERRVWNHFISNVTTISLLSGGTNFVWKHKGQYLWVPIAGVDQQRIRNNDTVTEMGMQRENAVFNLAEFDAGRWVERAPQDRARYGFTGPSRLVVTLEIQEGEKVVTREVEFGGDSPSGRYGSVKLDAPGGPQEWVFEYSANEVKQLYDSFSSDKQP